MRDDRGGQEAAGCARQMKGNAAAVARRQSGRRQFRKDWKFCQQPSKADGDATEEIRESTATTTSIMKKGMLSTLRAMAVSSASNLHLLNNQNRRRPPLKY